MGAVGLGLFPRGSHIYAHTSEYFIQGDTIPSDSIQADTLKPYTPSKTPTYNDAYRFGDPFSNRESPSSLLLTDPSSVDLEVEVDTGGVSYNVFERIGDVNFRPMTTMSFEEYDAHNDKEIQKEYFQERSSGLDGESAVSGRTLIPRLYISPMFDRLFGGSYVDIQPTGFVTLDFGGRFQRVDNPAISQRQQRNGGFNFDQQMSLNLVGKVGEKLAVTANFDNNNTFDFQNNMKVEYTGFEEDIVKKIEIGNVSMPVSNSLMTGAQSLFGVKTELQFGKLFVTGVVSRQQGKNEVISVGGGTDGGGYLGKEFEVRASEYDENRHFFLGHFFRDNYEKWHQNLPNITSSLNITRVEIYVINRNNDTRTTRQIAAFKDLGEATKIENSAFKSTSPLTLTADNSANELYEKIKGVDRNKDGIVNELDGIGNELDGVGLKETEDYLRIGTARKLEASEYIINSKLGYVTLLRKLQNDELLAVSYEYTYSGRSYKVGELTEDYSSRNENDVIFLKMLRPNKIDTESLTWDLMMKNIYYLNASQVQQEGFQLRIRYRDDASGIDNPSLHQGAQTANIPLIQLLGLDQLNQNGDLQRDGNFDYIEGVTIEERNGYLKFPVLEPFGATLESKFLPTENNLVDKYVYDTLYNGTQVNAQRVSNKDKFFITGKYNASGGQSEISIPAFNLSPGSVVVTAGNTPLTEGLDYTVDYNLGSVRILNDGILSSGKQINISYEKADLFNFQARWLYGARLDYRFNENFNIGATILHLNERQGGVSRFQIGDEPTSNTKYGFDINYQEEVPFLTKAMDFLPLVNTKEPSSVSFSAEFAQLVPGTSNIVNGEKTSYIDDFENAVSSIGIDGWAGWSLASTPFTLYKGRKGTQRVNDNRAKLAWYTVDQTVFYRSSGAINKPDNIRDEDLANHYVRPVGPQEIYRQRDNNQIVTFESIFDLAYYPEERGPYNYNNENGKLSQPQDSWGGITRAITNEVNFDKSNVEYIEFWMMDPFITGAAGAIAGPYSERSGVRDGKLVFNLGNVAEDLLQDNRHAFESGLPADGDPEGTNLDPNWGRTPQDPFLVNFFENSPSARPNQDIGLDGLKGTEEQILFGGSLPAGVDPNDASSDDFYHFLDARYDASDGKILERYKNWNGLENNSPIPSGRFPQSSTVIPDNEDLNRDLTIEGTSSESYFEYTVNLVDGELEIGKNFIADKVQGALVGDTPADWYLFRIPIRGSDRKAIGDIKDFSTIKFVRMYLTGFKSPVVLRMSDLQLVRSEWVKYDKSLKGGELSTIPENAYSDFNISVVNIEANGSGGPGKSPYVIPPGVQRDQDNTTINNRSLNEQSLQLCVEDLEDGDARAVFKNVGLDLINYGRLKMYFHAESYAGDMLTDNQVTGFVRLGTDQNDNYYEIEVPLKVTPLGTSFIDANTRPELIWPTENEISISINELLALKSERNKQKDSQLNDLDRRYAGESNDGKYKLYVRGNPDISTVQTMMIGVRNPVTGNGNSAQSACIWANEMRVTDFDTNKGWAANARLSTKLADVATVNASTRYTSIGFGSIQQNIQQRTREETIQYDISANVNVDKFLLPHKTGLKVPMFVGIERSRSTPQFDPLDPDTPLEASLESLTSDAERARYRKLVEDRTERRSINFTNVRKEKVNTESKSRIYDVENLSFSYAFSETESSNINTALLLQRTISGGVAYTFSPEGFIFQPFANGELFSSPYLQLIKDINFSPIPNNISVRADLNRNFRKTQLYDDDLNATDTSLLYYEKLFTFSRNYGLRWSPFKSLSLDYTARANAIIDENEANVEGAIDTDAEKSYIWGNIKNLGRMKNFDQDMTATYRLPLDKLPLTDWLSADVKYGVGYSWLAGAQNRSSELQERDVFFGHIIENSRDRGVNGKVDMTKLYDKVTFLKEAQAQKRGDEGSNVGNGILRFLMSIKNFNASYNIRETTTLPGFLKTPFLFGMDSSWNAPGVGFILGSQDPNIRFSAAENDWLTTNPDLTNPFMQTFTNDFSVKSSIEPFRDLKIQLDAIRSNSAAFQEIYRYDLDSSSTPPMPGFRSLTPARSGSYSISFLAIRTSFIKNRSDNSNPTFEQFETNVQTIKRRQEGENPRGAYKENSQDVLIPAFIAAYSGQDASDANLTPFPKIPIPNWRMDYTGLSKIPAIAKVFSSFTLSHGYRSLYSVNNYTNSLQYSEGIELNNNVLDYPQATELDDDGNFIPVYIINQVSIVEQFAPLVGLNVRTKNGLTIRFDYKKERNLSLEMSNAQVTEARNNDFTADFGVTKSDFKLPIKIRGRVVGVENDIIMRIAVTLRDATTLQRTLSNADAEGTNKVTQGNTSFKIRPQVTYKINDQMDLTAYYDRNINEPKISSSYKTSTTQFGFQLKFGLAQ